MPNKSFSNYSATAGNSVESSDQLVIEIAKSHIACIVTKNAKRSISAYELFTFKEDERVDFEKLLADIFSQSQFLSNTFSSVSIYINDAFCMPVPIFKFNKEIAAEYVDLVFGTDPLSKIQFEHLPIEPGIMNVYRVNAEAFACLNKSFAKASFHHTYSNIICRLTSIASGFPSEFISIQFYNTFMVVAVLKERALQLIQTFDYETPEDVLYYLINITQRFELYTDALTIQISGMIDLDFKLYRELITYYKNVVVEYATPRNLLLKVTEHPQHYFTPFFNLVK